MYEVDGFSVLNSGRDLSRSGETLQRVEGVTICLDPVMTAGWRDAGEMWTAVSSRIVSAHLQFKLGDSNSARNKLNVSVVSVYASTHRAPAEIKERFYDDLQAVIGSVPSSDLLLVMGDFNARVGCCGESSSMWSDVRGPFSVRQLNESGEALSSFCALNQLCIMNTMFQKREFTSTLGNIQELNCGIV